MNKRKPGRISLKGKYLLAVEQYVQGVDLSSKGLSPTYGNEHFLPLVELISKLHAKYLNEDHAASLVWAEYMEFLVDSKGEVQDWGDTASMQAKLVERLKARIESYPRQYLLRLHLPSFPAYRSQSIDFADDVRLVMKMPPKNLLKHLALPLGAVKHSEPFGAWLEIDAIGYGTPSPESPVVAASMSVIKQCLFVLESHSVLTTTYYNPRPADATLLDRHDDDLVQIALPTPFAQHCGRLIPNEDKLTVRDPGPTIAGGALRPAADEDEKTVALEDATACLQRFMKARQHPDFERLAAAIEWYQDSRVSDNQTFSYLSACIGLEAILGDESFMQEMSTRLADRYAFRMGTSRKSRDDFSKRYIEVLKLRGELVHAKAARLKSANDRRLLVEAQNMLHGLIWHELEILYKEEDTTKK